MARIINKHVFIASDHNGRRPRSRASGGRFATPILLGSISLLALMSGAMAQTTSGGAVNAGEVTAAGTATTAVTKALKATDGKLTKKKIFKSTQSEVVLGKRQIQAAGPAAGTAQILAINPGVAVRSYGGNSGTARYEVAVRGVKLGWSSVNGDAERNGLTALFDGIPMNNLISHNGQWDSNEIPIPQMLHGVNLIYGPGNPDTRWFDSIGGTINFIPLQPTAKPGGSIGGVFGSNATLGTHFDLETGLYHGWSAVLAGGYTSNDTFRTGGYNAPSHSDAFFGKVVKTFSNGSISFGGYYDNNVEFRPNFIPTAPIAGITTQGLNVAGPLYSQATSGFYSSLDKSIWFKRLTVQDYLLYSKLRLELSDSVTLHNKIWFRHGHRIHYRITNYSAVTAPSTSNSEWYTPTSNTYGDRAYLALKLPYNLVKVGGDFIIQHYNSPYAGYNDTLGIPVTAPSQYQNFSLDNTYLSAFLQDTVTPIRGLHITPALNEVEFQTRFNNPGLGAANNVVLAPDLSKTFTELEPSVGVSYRVLPWATVYGSYAVSYQNQTDNAFGANQQSPVDISAVRPVKSVDYEAGIRFLVKHYGILNNFVLNMNFYHDDLSHETIATYLANITLTKFAAANATLTGANITVSDDPNYHWHLFGNVGLNDSTFTSYTPSGAATLYNQPVSYAPHLIFTAGAFYRTLFHNVLISPNIIDQYVGQQDMFSNITGAPTRQSMAGYNVVNLGLNFRIPVHIAYAHAMKAVNVSFSVDNVLGTQYNPIQYISSGGYFGGNSAGAILADPGAPRQFFVTVSAHF